MAEELTVTLEAERGTNYDETGQAIASYGRSIVFLPRGVMPDQKVRVIIKEIKDKTDRRGCPMYEAVSAPLKYTERWEDNGDGTASRVEIAIDWLLQESEVKVIETRELGQREGTAHTRPKRSLVWGSSLNESSIEEIEVKTIPIEGEIVKNGELRWEKTGERKEWSQPLHRPIKEVVNVREDWSDSWWRNRLKAVYDNSWPLKLSVSFEGESWPKEFNTTWGQIPAWLQSELSARYPVCSCGRQRRDVRVEDGYGKCELCRAEETCERCGKQAKVVVIENHLVCENCQPYEEQEQLIAAHLTSVHRQAIADEAKKLLQGQGLDAETGLAVLKAGLGHVSSDYTRDRILNRWKEYRWYFFTDEGVFGTKFEPAALEVLQCLLQATGNSLVDLVAWVVGGPKPLRSDFYLRTQVEGKKGIVPKITENLLEQVAVQAGEPVLADRLRGPEAERLEALELFRQGQEELSDYSWGSKIYKLCEKARGVLEGREQDYGSAISALKEAFALKAKYQLLDDLLAREYSFCPVCSGEIERDSSHYCQEQKVLFTRGQYQDFKVKVSRVGEIELVSLVAIFDDYHGDYELWLEIHEENLGVISDPSQIETETFWREPSARERELAEQISRLRVQLETIRYERERPATRVEGIFKAVEHRGKTQLQFEGTFTGTVENRLAKEGYSSYEDQPALFVCRYECPWLDEEPKAGQRWICSLAFQIGVNKGRPIIVVNPQIRSDLEEKLKRELVQLEAELVAEREKVEPFDKNGQPNTAIAAALREAGLA